MIRVVGLSKSYDAKKVVKNVSVDIEKGKVTAFIGPNGAGKSTLLSMISRLLPKDEGEVYIEDKRLEEWEDKELAKKMAILRQTNHTTIRLTIRELVSFGRFPYSQGNLKQEDEKFVDQAIAYMKLEDIQDKYLDELSGGQRQRAYIAMVIAQDTEYILLDEPLNNLDMKHSVEMMRILKRLAKELGKTIVIVIHDINFAARYADKVIILKDGELVQNGSVKKVIQKNILEEIYEMAFDIMEIKGKPVCIYY